MGATVQRAKRGDARVLNGRDGGGGKERKERSGWVCAVSERERKRDWRGRDDGPELFFQLG